MRQVYRLQVPIYRSLQCRPLADFTPPMVIRIKTDLLLSDWPIFKEIIFMFYTRRGTSFQKLVLLNCSNFNIYGTVRQSQIHKFKLFFTKKLAKIRYFMHWSVIFFEGGYPPLFLRLLNWEDLGLCGSAHGYIKHSIASVPRDRKLH